MRFFTNWQQIPVVMNLQTACTILGRSYDNLQKAAKDGTFPAFKNGERKWAVKKDDLLDYIEKQKTA
ncbi:MAG TPA: DNA-binding protein [Clostridiaceae bacterium]|jgi:excisionase family DNA binding protein|nr:DNA-binding protein [Clostridiaceae bacterium]